MTKFYLHRLGHVFRTCLTKSVAGCFFRRILEGMVTSAGRPCGTAMRALANDKDHLKFSDRSEGRTPLQLTLLACTGPSCRVSFRW